ncbi:MAG: hypothetical protein IE891_09465 [Flavobacteriaceae bacterium]|nr:hypothetical protein [Flavobacteriaceae bacterium]
MYWNFLSSDKEIIENAKKKWQNQNYNAFTKVPEDEDAYVPLPVNLFNKN